jgi:hypothetical protein
MNNKIIIKTLITFFVILMFGCKPLMYIPGSSHMFGVDFRKYAEKGFLFTPEMYNGEYSTIGYMDYTLSPSAEYKNKSSWVIQKIKLTDAIDTVYNHCIYMGADALVKFEFSTIDVTHNKNDEGYAIPNPVTIQEIRITGIAIKRNH